eukprot:2216596-Pyramimonas_sp.AAC.1
MRFMHGVRGCERTLELLPAWVSEFFTSAPVFTILACGESDQVYVHIEKAHDRLLAAHEKVDRADKATPGIIEAGSEQSPHELADRGMGKWMKVWSVHDDSDISLPFDSGEWDLLPYSTADMM